MEFDIINTNHVFNHKIFNFWKIPFFIYGVLLIYYTADSGIEKLNNYETTFKIISGFFLISGFLLVLANNFIFSRVGKLIIEKNNLTIENGKIKNIIDLNQVKEITFGKEQKDFYNLKINNCKIVIELKNTDLEEFKKTIENFNIEIKHRNFLDRILNWVDKNTLHNTRL